MPFPFRRDSEIKPSQKSVLPGECLELSSPPNISRPGVGSRSTVFRAVTDRRMLRSGLSEHGVPSCLLRRRSSGGHLGSLTARRYETVAAIPASATERTAQTDASPHAGQHACLPDAPTWIRHETVVAPCKFTTKRSRMSANMSSPTRHIGLDELPPRPAL